MYRAAARRPGPRERRYGDSLRPRLRGRGGTLQRLRRPVQPEDGEGYDGIHLPRACSSRAGFPRVFGGGWEGRLQVGGGGAGGGKFVAFVDVGAGRGLCRGGGGGA